MERGGERRISFSLHKLRREGKKSIALDRIQYPRSAPLAERNFLASRRRPNKTQERGCLPLNRKREMEDPMAGGRKIETFLIAKMVQSLQTKRSRRSINNKSCS